MEEGSGKWRWSWCGGGSGHDGGVQGVRVGEGGGSEEGGGKLRVGWYDG